MISSGRFALTQTLDWSSTYFFINTDERLKKYNTYWPDAYMDLTDYFLIISKTNQHLRTNTLSSPQYKKMKKKTQTSITYNKHKQTIYQMLDPTSVQF